MTLPWYPRDMGKYARDTKNLSLLEHGAYNLLLDYYYSTGPLEAEQCSSNAQLMPDHSRLYRICSAMTKPEQDAVDHVLKKFFKLDKKGFYRNAKADEVIETQTEKHENRVRAGRENKAKAMLKQCSSNTPQTKKETKNNPPYPPRGAPAARGSDSGFGKEEFFSIEKYLSDDDMAAAKRNAPGWDLQVLMRTYDEGINGGERDRPRKPAAAFIAWCLAYTKGKQP